ncbi:hypothetical protein BpHYR1_020120 [Brachionus plicatilis]|uniref:Uncharacterized protein n=1 Tax=Brachionus plicatilis TaxID=10195 RepID=A0A3M7RXY0_BRAPC|nr:hypothetical protein BpHYR1_020120 [Brachionus plicatilis]
MALKELLDNDEFANKPKRGRNKLAERLIRFFVLRRGNENHSAKKVSLLSYTKRFMGDFQAAQNGLLFLFSLHKIKLNRISREKIET